VGGTVQLNNTLFLISKHQYLLHFQSEIIKTNLKVAPVLHNIYCFCYELACEMIYVVLSSSTAHDLLEFQKKIHPNDVKEFNTGTKVTKMHGTENSHFSIPVEKSH